MRFLTLLLLAILSACDQSGHVYVAPSAHHLMDEIERAVWELNSAANMEVYVVHETDSEGRVDDGIVIRVVDDLHRGDNTIGLHKPSMRGSVIQVLPDVGSHLIAHELAHARGLGHVDGQDNLMYKNPPRTWTLTEKQLDELRNNPY